MSLSKYTGATVHCSVKCKCALHGWVCLFILKSTQDATEKLFFVEAQKISWEEKKNQN